MFNIIGIDPGTNFVGVSVLEIDSNTFTINKIITHVLDISNIQNTNSLNNNIVYRLGILTNNIRQIVELYSPKTIGIESPFINMLRPISVVPLSQSVQAIEYGIYLYDKNILIGKYPPSTIKKTVGAKGGSDKIEILDAMLKLTEVSSKINLLNLTDHEVDATAIGYCILKDITYNPLILF